MTRKKFWKNNSGGQGVTLKVGGVPKNIFPANFSAKQKISFCDNPSSPHCYQKKSVSIWNHVGSTFPPPPEKNDNFRGFYGFSRPDGGTLRNTLEIVIELSTAVSAHFTRSKSVHK
jgi:hypothetical protein